jgi:hypothetical protein
MYELKFEGFTKSAHEPPKRHIDVEPGESRSGDREKPFQGIQSACYVLKRPTAAAGCSVLSPESGRVARPEATRGILRPMVHPPALPPERIHALLAGLPAIRALPFSPGRKRHRAIGPPAWR